MFMSIEQLLLVEKQRQIQREVDLFRTRFPEQECVKEKKLLQDFPSGLEVYWSAQGKNLTLC